MLKMKAVKLLEIKAEQKHKEAQTLMGQYNVEKATLSEEEQEAEQKAEEAFVETILAAEGEAREMVMKEEEAAVESMADGEKKAVAQQALEVAQLKAEATAAEEEALIQDGIEGALADPEDLVVQVKKLQAKNVSLEDELKCQLEIKADLEDDLVNKMAQLQMITEQSHTTTEVQHLSDQLAKKDAELEKLRLHNIELERLVSQKDKEIVTLKTLLQLSKKKTQNYAGSRVEELEAKLKAAETRIRAFGEMETGLVAAQVAAQKNLHDEQQRGIKLEKELAHKEDQIHALQSALGSVNRRHEKEMIHRSDSQGASCSSGPAKGATRKQKMLQKMPGSAMQRLTQSARALR